MRALPRTYTVSSGVLVGWIKTVSVFHTTRLKVSHGGGGERCPSDLILIVGVLVTESVLHRLSEPSRSSWHSNHEVHLVKSSINACFLLILIKLPLVAAHLCRLLFNERTSAFSNSSV